MVFGNDYPTPDGTGVRDYIHVMDLAAGHLAALTYLRGKTGIFRWNLGTGSGSSVLDVIQEFGKAAGRRVAHEFAPRRPGDAAISYADPTAALTDLGWSATRDLAEMCEDHWRWQRNNPQGYGSAEGVQYPLDSLTLAAPRTGASFGRPDHSCEPFAVSKSAFSTSRYIVDPFGCAICAQDNEIYCSYWGTSDTTTNRDRYGIPRRDPCGMHG